MPDQPEEQRDPATPGTVRTDEAAWLSTGTDPVPDVVDATTRPDSGHEGPANMQGPDVAPGAKPADSVQDETDWPETPGDHPTDAVEAYRLGAQLLRELMRPEDDEPGPA